MRARQASRPADRRSRVTLDKGGVIQEFGVAPESIPDYLALVGDTADGYPGLPGWGATSSAAVLAEFIHLESIPTDWPEWRVNVANAGALARTLSSEQDHALPFRTLATLRTDIALFDDVDELQWRGPKPGFETLGLTRSLRHWRQAERGPSIAVALRFFARGGGTGPRSWGTALRRAG
jgi:5'-3' exonuclease